jgi:hypothetical protein
MVGGASYIAGHSPAKAGLPVTLTWIEVGLPVTALRGYNNSAIAHVRFLHEERRTMSAIRATWKNGQIVPDQPVDWPEGLELQVEPLPAIADNASVSPEEIARTLAAMDRVEPLELSDQEKADLDAWEQKVNAYGIANMDRGVQDVFQ